MYFTVPKKLVRKSSLSKNYSKLKQEGLQNYENHHFAIPYEIMDLGNNHPWLPKASGEC